MATEEKQKEERYVKHRFEGIGFWWLFKVVFFWSAVFFAVTQALDFKERNVWDMHEFKDRFNDKCIDICVGQTMAMATEMKNNNYMPQEKFDIVAEGIHGICEQDCDKATH